jgi:hypothetical protein
MVKKKHSKFRKLIKILKMKAIIKLIKQKQKIVQTQKEKKNSNKTQACLNFSI